MSLYYKGIESPLGELHLIASANALVGIEWPCRRQDRLSLTAAANTVVRHPVIAEAERQLSEYFAGMRTEFELPVVLSGTTFQKTVWEALRRIPFGETKSYVEIASAIGSPRACRAVGAANGKNPIPIIIPCHRVVGKSGSLVGFAGGLEIKARLLTLERQQRCDYSKQRELIVPAPLNEFPESLRPTASSTSFTNRVRDPNIK